MTHSEITLLASKWLSKHSENVTVPNCNLVAYETKTATESGEIPDVIGWCSWASILIEVKISRGDFLKDKKKSFRLDSKLGVGNFRYYICPSGLIDPRELPEDWGLLYIDDKGKIKIEKKSNNQFANTESERTMLLSIIRRSKK